MAGLSQKSMMEALPAYVSYEIPRNFQEAYQDQYGQQNGIQHHPACARLQTFGQKIHAERQRDKEKITF